MTNTQKPAGGNLLKRLDRFQKNTRTIDDNYVYHDSVKEFLDLRIEKLKERLTEFQDVLFAIGELDFSKKLEHDPGHDVFAYFVQSINLLSEELESKIFPHHKEILESLSEAVVVTDKFRCIQSSNKSFKQMISATGEEIEGKSLTDFIEFDIDLDIDLDSKISKVHGRVKKPASPVIITVKAIVRNKQIEGYFYIINNGKIL